MVKLVESRGSVGSFWYTGMYGVEARVVGLWGLDWFGSVCWRMKKMQRGVVLRWG